MIRSAKYPAVIIAVSQVLGIFAAQYLGAAVYLLTLLLPVLSLLLYRSPKNWKSWVGLLAVLMAVFSYTVRKTTINHPLDLQLPLKNVEIAGRIKQVSGEEKQNLVVDLDSIKIGEHWHKLSRSVYLRLSKADNYFEENRYIFVKNIELQPRPLPRNPGQFNFAAYLANQGIWAYSGLNKKSAVAGHHASGTFSEKWSLTFFRNRILQQIDLLFLKENAGFVKGIILGVSDQIPPEMKAQFRRSGVAHVLAISGLHVGFLALGIGLLLSFFNFKYGLQNFLIVMLLWIYALLVGGKPSVVRAVLMITFFLAGKVIERKSIPLNSMAAAFVIILLVNPQQLFNVGFQYSFAAVFSILYFFPKLQTLSEKLTPKFISPPFLSFYRKWILGAFFVSFAAQIGTIPITAYYFQHLSIISFILNIIVIPVVGLILTVAFAALLISISILSLGQSIAGIADVLILLLSKMVYFASKLPFAAVELPVFSKTWILIYLIVVLLFFYWKEINVQIRYAALVAILLSVVFLSIPPQNMLNQILLDVGQGEANLIISPQGKTVLYDTGPATFKWDSGQDVIYPVLKYLGKNRIDKVFLSHPHADHIGGFYQLYNLVQIDSVYLPNIDISYSPFTRLMAFLKLNKIPVRKIKPGELIPVDAETKIYVLGPGSEYCKPGSNSGHNINNTSLVLKYQHRNASILLAGDMERDCEVNLLKWRKFLKSDILLAGHHGSITSNSMPYLSMVLPEWSLITVGSFNRYGHPSAEVVERFKSLNSSIGRTDKDGAVWLIYKNGKWQEKMWR